VLDSADLRLGPVEGFCDHGNAFLSSIEAGHFLTILVTIAFSVKALDHGVTVTSK
jgi:hypothetical protein